MELEENKRIMIDALKKVYKDQYDTIQPIPYVKDKLYCVDKVFVEGGSDVTFFKGNPPTDFKKLNWRKLNSYKEIFTEDNIQSHRCIIDGEPGYGKSTLTLQLAYDWSNGISDSPLCDVKIFIFLRLRQLKNLGSIYKAIKLILLSTEPRLKVKDIQQILETCSSVVYALDGYDEFPHQNEEQNDINKILTSDLFQNIDVTLTTRILPTQLTRVNDSHSSDGPTTKLVKLRGFDEAAREQYIRKAVTGDDDTAVERIKEQLRENHAINALCQVPLLFVIFAHMCLDDHVIPIISTVTGAVRHMISCFHKHMREKMKDSNVKTLPDFENEHSELDKIAFDGLQNQHLMWKREELRQRLGAAFYDMYVRIGILEEEKVFYESSLTIEVHFYHKIFCEWFAAHALVDTAIKTGVSAQESGLLFNLNPNDLKYFFRFVCGIDHEAGNEVIQHMHKRHMDNELLACISERLDNIAGIKDVVKDICSKPHVVFEGSNMMRMRDALRVLSLGCANEFAIESLSVSLGSYHVDSEGILFPSGLRVPFYNTLKQLGVEFGERKEIREEEVVAALQTAMNFERLNEIRFDYCVLPQQMPTVATVIDTRDISIMWRIHTSFGISIMNQLKPPLGEWELQNLDDIKSICNGDGILPTFRISRSLLTHEWFVFSTRRLFEEAKNHKIPIRRLTIDDKPYNDNETVSVLANSDFLPPSIFYSVEMITLSTERRNINEGECINIMNYILGITNLKEVWYDGFSLPPKNSAQFFSTLRSNNVNVCRGFPL